MKRYLILVFVLCLLFGCGGGPKAGETRVREIDGMVMVYVPAGEFLMGSTDDVPYAEDDEKPQHTVYLDAFWIDKYEVTNAQYRACVEAGACEESGWWDADYVNAPDQPVVFVTWDDAQDYAAWAGGRLPTEAEWEKAARGTDGRIYPWGDIYPDCDKANRGGCAGKPLPVGSHPDGASPYGALDMMGNVTEWVADWYDEDYYSQSPFRNPQGPESGNYHVLRGGAFMVMDRVRHVRCAARDGLQSFDRGAFAGFRVVVDPTPVLTEMPLSTSTPKPLAETPTATSTVTPAAETPSSTNSGRIAFHSDRDGDWEIYVMNADGSGLTNLTDGPDASGWRPAWSPDGTRIAFLSERDSNLEIYVMNADGSEQTNLSNNLGGDSDPAWSPDGTRIAFVSERDGNWEIYVMNADGSGLTNLTDNPADDWNHVWSPDGTRIAFASDRDANVEIYVMNADGSGLTDLTGNPADDWNHVWSPDGTRIAFMSERDGNIETYFMNADGSGLTKLTDNPGDDGGPAWSPDGTRIAFMSERDGNLEIYVMNADGSGQTRLTDNPAEDWGFVWSPDGTRIAFMSDRDGNWEIYVMNADGSGLTRLTDSPGDDRFPAWSP